MVNNFKGITVAKIKIKVIHVICLLQLLLQITFLIFGICFKSDSNVLNTSFLSLLTKVQSTNTLGRFFWCFTNNISVLYMIFWINYWSFGILGTIWCVGSSFMLGAVIEFALICNSWISVFFSVLELLASMIIILSSTYFRFEKFEKKVRHRYILIFLLVVAAILLVAAVLETIALNMISGPKI